MLTMMKRMTEVKEAEVAGAGAGAGAGAEAEAGAKIDYSKCVHLSKSGSPFLHAL
jgi:hypothetical protein